MPLPRSVLSTPSSSSSPTLLSPVEIPRSPATPDVPAPLEDVLLQVPQRSHPLAAGDLSLHRIRAENTSLAAIGALGTVQWPLARDVAAVKLDPLHFSFSFTVPSSPDDPAPDPLHYGLTLFVPDPRLDALLGAYTRFSAHSVAGSEGLADGVRREVEAATDLGPPRQRRGVRRHAEPSCPHRECRQGILWCGVTVGKVHWGTRCSGRGSSSAILRPRLINQWGCDE
ncbi:hypothetical protein ZWY2020_042234 [Hordeum vulgare]|nr:hypothetical protein ZWY2020_042234 [Hordeum vulgare]